MGGKGRRGGGKKKRKKEKKEKKKKKKEKREKRRRSLVECPKGQFQMILFIVCEYCFEVSCDISLLFVLT